MKKIIITAVIIATLSGTAYGAIKVQTSDRLANGLSQRIYSDVLDRENKEVIKFIDGKNTCYLVSNKVDNKTLSTAISCVN